MPAGSLRERITFDARAVTDDGYGNPVSGDFTEQFTVWGRVRPLKGGETVLASRLAGTQPVIITVRDTSDTREITSAWRARVGSVTYALTSPPANMDERRQYFDILATVGIAA